MQHTARALAAAYALLMDFRKFGELSNIALMAAQKVDACISRIWSGSTTDELAARLRLDKFVTEQQQK